MASIASPHFYRKYPLETIDANVSGLKLLLETFKNQKTNLLFQVVKFMVIHQKSIFQPVRVI